MAQWTEPEDRGKAPQPAKPDRWGPWRLVPENYTLLYADEPGGWYEIDLEDCTSSAEVLDWIMQINHKAWGTPAVISSLVSALDAILRPQANLCSDGKSKRLTKTRIREMVDDYHEQRSAGGQA